MAFMGSDAIALPMLDELDRNFCNVVEMIGIFTQPDRRQGRGMQAKANPIKHWGQERGIPVLQPERIAKPQCQWLALHGCTLILVMAYGQILRRRLLTLPSLGIFNVHTSLLPAYRGASPIQTAIACGETTSGITLMGVSPAMDAGPIVDQEIVAIDPADNSEAVRHKMAMACCPLLQRNLAQVLSGQVRFTPQDSHQASYCRRLQKEDAALNFNAAAKVLYDRIRAFQPWPGTFFEWEGTRIKVGAAQWLPEQSSAVAGTLLGLQAGGLAVATGQGVLLLTQLQRPGGRMLPAKTFLSGYSFPEAAVLSSQDMPSLVVNRQ